jgi:hypothetical protein
MHSQELEEDVLEDEHLRCEIRRMNGNIPGRPS